MRVPQLDEVHRISYHHLHLRYCFCYPMYNGHVDVDAIIGLTVWLMIISVHLIYNCEKVHKIWWFLNNVQIYLNKIEKVQKVRAAKVVFEL